MGFFYTEQPRPQVSKSSPTRRSPSAPKASAVQQIQLMAVRGCAACPLDKVPGLEHPKMVPTGAAKPLVYILGDAPGQREDEQGEHLVGPSGNLLRDTIPARLKKYVRWNNLIRCRPPRDRDPAPLETECCRQLQVKDIEQTRPKVILGLGDAPLQWFTQDAKAKIGIWRGRRVAVKLGAHCCWYYPVWHPSFMLKQQHSRRADEFVEVFQRDIRRALEDAENESLEPPVVEDTAQYNTGVETLEKPDLPRLQKWFKEIATWEECAIDIETNALRPYFKERRILSIAISNYEKTFCFAYQHPTLDWAEDLPRVKKVVRSFLLSKIRKWCHNEKFEMEWLCDEFGEDVLWKGQWADTFAQAYVLDERAGAKDLGSLTLIHFGFNVKKLSTVDVKRLAEAPLNQVLPYNALDAKYTLPLSWVMRQELEVEGLEKVYDEQHRRAVPIVLAQRRGLQPDTDTASKLATDYSRKIDTAQNKIMQHKDVLRFIQEGNPFSATSNPNLLHFFRDFLGFTQACNKGRKDSPKWSTDEEVLSKIRHPVAKLVLEIRKASKLCSTYCQPLSKEGEQVHGDGKIHTNYNHCLTSTRRLSSDAPNVQNFPKRKDKHVRAVIRSPDGFWLCSFDYGQIEFRVIGMASKDPTLVQATWENYDVHQEWAERLVKDKPHLRQVMIDEFGAPADDEKVIMKKLRDEVKNRWVFPLFFGSHQSSVEESLWCSPGDLKQAHTEFWKMFSGVHKWQDQVVEDYHKNGYVETLTGFRRRAPLKRNEAINEPIQGTAADIVSDGMCRLSDIARELQQDEFQFRLQVHDDLGFYLPDTDLEESAEIVAKEMCRAPFDFVCTPITVEVAVGRNWSQQESMGVVSSKDYGFHTRPKWLKGK